VERDEDRKFIDSDDDQADLMAEYKQDKQKFDDDVADHDFEKRDDEEDGKKRNKKKKNSAEEEIAMDQEKKR
jgi:hypothetical protein